MSKKDIRKLTLDEIISETAEFGFEKFRAKQIHQWLWQKSAKSFDEMLNLSKKHREILHTHFEINPVKIAESQRSVDGTFKYALELFDHKITEGVLIPTEKRNTACVSSQVGCSLACAFCATGKLKMMRNIDAAEIYDQVAIIDAESKAHYGKGLTNIVFM